MWHWIIIILGQVLVRLTRGVLRLTEVEAMEVLRKRLSRLRSRQQFSEELLQVDEAQACLDEDDPNSSL